MMERNNGIVDGSKDTVEVKGRKRMSAIVVATCSLLVGGNYVL